jgi:endonuclease YncB( thermonuclease family)
MQILSTVALAAVAAIHIFAPQRPARAGPVLVTAVIDGGTIDVQSIGRVRLLGIAAPRLDRRGSASAPFAVDARDRLSSLVASRWVRLEYDTGTRTTASARSAYVLLDDGTCVNEVLVREGLARATGRAALSRAPQLRRARDEAERQERGIWSPLASAGTEMYKRRTLSKPKTKKKGGG